MSIQSEFCCAKLAARQEENVFDPGFDNALCNIIRELQHPGSTI